MNIKKLNTLHKGAYYKILTIKEQTEKSNDFGGVRAYKELLLMYNTSQITKISTYAIRFGCAYEKVCKRTMMPLTPSQEQEYKDRAVKPYYIKHTTYMNKHNNVILQCYLGGLGAKSWYLDENGNDITSKVMQYKKSKPLNDERYVTIKVENIIDIDKADIINKQLKKII